MSSLWESFCAQLSRSGYTPSDLAYCSEDLFLTIAEELGTLSPLQISTLVREWQTHHRHVDTAAPAAAAVPTILSSGHQVPLHLAMDHGAQSRNGTADAVRRTPMDAMWRSGETMLRSLSSSMGVRAIRMADAGAAAAALICFELSREALTVYERRFASLRSADTMGQQQQLLWKLCSPASMARLDRCSRTAEPILLSNGDDQDGLCESAVVLYRDTASSLVVPSLSSSSSPSSMVDRIARGWAMVAFDVLVGHTRRVSVEEAANLNAFSMRECLGMLEDASYDSLSIDERGAVLICDTTQILPRAIMRVEVGEQDVPRAGLGFTPLQRQPPAAGATASTPRTSGTAATLLTPSCSVHPTKEVEFWCPQEKRLLCSMCLYYDGYSRENCVPLEHGARQEAPRLERWMHNAGTFSKEVAGVLQLFDAAVADVAASESEAADAVRRAFANLRASVDAAESALLAQCHGTARLQSQQLATALADVSGVVGQVQDVVAEVEVPLRSYRTGSSERAMSLSLLRGAQKAFGVWEPVGIPPYSVVMSVESDLLRPVEAALKQISELGEGCGKVELPESIDVNYLKNGCTSDADEPLK